MATTQHYLWASGHFLLLATALRYLFAVVLFRTISVWWYKAALTGALLSYAIVCHKSLGTPQPSLAFVRRAMIDENVQYFLLAAFWWSSKPVAIALLPFITFSLFHALTFTRTTLMPQILPQGPPATAGGPPTPHPLAKKLQAWVKANYDTAMKAVAYTELIIFVRVLFGAVLLQNSLISPVIFAHFLRQRYYQSSFTRDAVGFADNYTTQLAHRPGIPPVVAQVWAKGRELIGRWGGSSLTGGAPPAAPAAGARRG